MKITPVFLELPERVKAEGLFGIVYFDMIDGKGPDITVNARLFWYFERDNYAAAQKFQEVCQYIEGKRAAPDYLLSAEQVAELAAKYGAK